MGKFWSSENCAALISSYSKMPLRYKFLYWGIIVGPTTLTAAAFAQRAGVLGLETAPIWFFWPLAALYWILMIPLVTNHVRGRLALRRGISPVSPVRKVNYYGPRWELVFWPIMILLFLFLAISGHASHKSDPTALSMALMSSATFSLVLYQFSVKKFQLHGSVPEA